jgi:cell volume regulation protein A
MLIGPVLNLIEPQALTGFAALVGTLALVIIVFEGGINLNFNQVIRELTESTWFTVLACVVTAFFVMLVMMALGWSAPYGLLLGFIVAGTSYEIVVPLIARLSVSEDAKTLLNLESAMNDAVTIVATIAIIQFLAPAQSFLITGFNALDPMQKVASAFSIAITAGIIFGVVWARVLASKLHGKPFGYLLTLATVFVLFAVVESLGGNGITSILVFGLVLGNFGPFAEFLRTKEKEGAFQISPEIKSFQTEVSFFVKTLFFVYMGIVFNFGAISQTTLFYAALVFTAIVLARWLVVKLLVSVNRSLKQSKSMIFLMLPRGLATAVLATLPAASRLSVPYLVEIVLLIIIFSNVFATIGVFLSEFRRGKGTQEILASGTIEGHL